MNNWELSPPRESCAALYLHVNEDSPPQSPKSPVEGSPATRTQPTLTPARKNLETLFKDPEWSVWSNRKIDEKCVVSNYYVIFLRDKIKSGNVSIKSESRRRRNKAGQSCCMSSLARSVEAARERWCPAKSPRLERKPCLPKRRWYQSRYQPSATLAVESNDLATDRVSRRRRISVAAESRT